MWLRDFGGSSRLLLYSRLFFTNKLKHKKMDILEDSWHVHCIGSIPSSLDMRCVGDSEVRFLSCQFLSNVPTLVDGGVCGSVDSATSYKRVLVAGRIIKN